MFFFTLSLRRTNYTGTTTTTRITLVTPLRTKKIEDQMFLLNSLWGALLKSARTLDVVSCQIHRFDRGTSMDQYGCSCGRAHLDRRIIFLVHIPKVPSRMGVRRTVSSQQVAHSGPLKERQIFFRWRAMPMHKNIKIFPLVLHGSK